MHHFTYRNGVMHAEAVDLVDLAASVGTPFYCYSTATLLRHYKVFAEAFADVRAFICYAMKANSNQAVVATLAKLGAGADVVSGGELKRALAAGVPPDRIMFSGVGKTASELAAAVDAGILCVNVESEAELALLSAIASGKGRSVNVSVRVNPDVDPKTHAKIATGKAENKFGIPISRAREVYAHAAKMPGLRVTGVDMHIGSQITELSPFDDAFALLSDFVRALRVDGHHIEHVDLGGGLGIPYREDNDPPPLPDDYAAVVKRATRDLDCMLIFEPGRLIVGNAGILVTRVLYVKRGEAQDVRDRRRRHERPDPSDALRRTPRRTARGRATGRGPPRRRRGWTGLRVRRFSRARSRASRACAGRSFGHHDCWCLWGRAGRHLQHARPRSRGPGKGSAVGPGAAARRGRPVDCARPPAILDMTAKRPHCAL